MAEITKKCEKRWFDKILSGEKNFEVRLADFEINNGDTLILNEVVEGKHTGKSIKKKVICVAKTKDMNYWPKEDIDKYGFQIIGLD